MEAKQLATDPDGKGRSDGCVEVCFNPGTMFLYRRDGLKDAPSIGWRARLHPRFLLARMLCVVAIATGH